MIPITLSTHYQQECWYITTKRPVSVAAFRSLVSAGRISLGFLPGDFLTFMVQNTGKACGAHSNLTEEARKNQNHPSTVAMAIGGKNSMIFVEVATKFRERCFGSWRSLVRYRTASRNSPKCPDLGMLKWLIPVEFASKLCNILLLLISF